MSTIVFILEFMN